jgi:hypothetical protein
MQLNSQQGGANGRDVRALNRHVLRAGIRRAAEQVRGDVLSGSHVYS